MMHIILRTGLAGAALLAGGLLAHAQSLPPPGPPAESVPDQGYDMPATPAPPAVPAPDDDSDVD